MHTSSIVASGDYSQTNNCPPNLAPNGSCTITVQFTPAATGKRYGSVVIASDDGATPAILSLTGIGTYVSVSPVTLQFGNQSVGTSSRPRSFTLVNNGPSTLTISQVSFEGTLQQTILDFSQTDDCTASIAPGASCTFNITFSPKTPGFRSGYITIFDSEIATSPHTVKLAGTGIQ